MANYEISDWVAIASTEDGYNTKENEISKDLAGSIDLGVYSLGQLFTDIGPYLAEGADLVDVAKVLKLIAPVLASIEETPRLHDVHLLVEYLCSRLRNTDNLHNYRAGIREVNAALQVLAKWDSFPRGDFSVVASAIFSLSEATTFKDQTPTTRQELWVFISHLVRNQETVLKRDLGAATVVKGIVSMGLAEKNPSCLEVLFPLYSHISRQWKLEPVEFDSIWDSFIRYFPVQVGNAVKESLASSKEHMRSLLLQCIVSNDYYATKAFGRLIEMLDTESDLSANTKKEVFATLLACCKEGYSPTTLASWTTKLWDALKFEIWNGDNEDFIDGSLKILNILTVALVNPRPECSQKEDPQASPQMPEWSANNEDPLTLYVITVSSECKTRMNDSKRQYLLPSAKILHSIASGTPYSFHLVASTVLPALLVMWQDVSLASEKKMVLEVFNKILEARLKHLLPKPVVGDVGADEDDITGRKEKSDEHIKSMEASFAKFNSDLIEVYFGLVPDVSGLINFADPEKEAPLGVAAVQGFTLLFEIPGYLSTAEQNMVVTELCRIAMEESASVAVHDFALAALTEMSASQPDVYQNTTLEFFASKLPQALRTDDNLRRKELELVHTILDNLIQISCSTYCHKENDIGCPPAVHSSFWHRNFDATVFKLLWVLDEALKSKQQREYAQAIIVAVCIGIQRFDQALDKAALVLREPTTNLGHGDGPYTWIVLRLLGLVLEQKPLGDGPGYVGISNLPGSTVPYDDLTVDYIGQIAMISLRSVRTKTQYHDFIRIAHNFYAAESQQALVAGKPLPTQPSVFWTLFTEGENLEAIAQSQYKLQDGPADKCTANLISTYLLAGFSTHKGEITPGTEDILHFNPGHVASEMIKSSVSMSSKASVHGRLSMLWTLQLLVNKYRANETESLCNIMQDIVSTCSTKDDTEVQYILQTLAYFASASLAALQPTATKLINLMVAGVSDPKHGQIYASSFRILLSPSPIINKENSCILRPLRKNKLFHLIFHPLHKAWVAGDRKIKNNTLIALSGVLCYLDAETYTDAAIASLLLPLILDGCDIQDNVWSKARFIGTLSVLVSHCPALIDEYRKSVITRLTDRTHNTLYSPSDSDITSRSLALDVLTNIIKTLPPASILKEKTRLTTELNFALDDPSRDVRERAQRCKTALLCLVEPAVDS